MALRWDPLGRRSLWGRFVFYLSAVVLITMISTGTIVCQEAYRVILEETAMRARALLERMAAGERPVLTDDIVGVGRLEPDGIATTVAGRPVGDFIVPPDPGPGPFLLGRRDGGPETYGFLRQAGRDQWLMAISRAPVLRPVRWVAMTMVWLTVLSLAINVLLASLMAKRILAPYRQVLDGMQRIMHGRYNVELAVEEEDEVGRLKSTFNYMQAQIKEKEFLERQVLFQERMAFIGQLASGVAHEIRNPLASISSLTQLMAAEAAGHEKVQEYARVIAREVERLNRSVEQLLTYAKPVPTEFAPQMLSEIVEGVVGLMAHESKTRQTTLGFANHWSAEMPFLVDGPKLAQVLINLIKNALEALGHGGHVAVTLRYDRDEEKATITVVDDGPGIPLELREHLFDPFFSTKRRGSGLGLAISAKIVAVHNGQITVDSEIGRGTRFSVTLPRLDEQMAARLKDVA